MSDSLALSRLPHTDACHINDIERLVYELFYDEKARVLLRVLRDHYFKSEMTPAPTDTKAILAWFAKVEFLSDLSHIVDSVEKKLHNHHQRGKS